MNRLASWIDRDKKCSACAGAHEIVSNGAKVDCPVCAIPDDHALERAARQLCADEGVTPSAKVTFLGFVEPLRTSVGPMLIGEWRPQPAWECFVQLAYRAIRAQRWAEFTRIGGEA